MNLHIVTKKAFLWIGKRRSQKMYLLFVLYMSKFLSKINLENQIVINSVLLISCWEFLESQFATVCGKMKIKHLRNNI